MASTVYLPVGSLLYIDTSATDTPTWVKLSEHNRQPMSIEQNRIQKVTRMSQGTLRKFFIADKREFSTSWNMLPSFSNMTVDAGYGAEILSKVGNYAGQFINEASPTVAAAKRDQPGQTVININNSTSTAVKVGAPQGSSTTVARPVGTA